MLYPARGRGSLAFSLALFQVRGVTPEVPTLDGNLLLEERNSLLQGCCGLLTICLGLLSSVALFRAAAQESNDQQEGWADCTV